MAAEIDPIVVLAGLAIAFGGTHVLGRGIEPAADRVVAATGRDPDETGIGLELVYSDLSKMLAAGLLVGYVLVVENRGLGSLTGPGLGMGPTWTVAAVAGGVTAMLAQAILTEPVFQRYGVDGNLAERMAELSELGLARRLSVAVVAGVTEELLFRGYPVERLIDLTGSPLLAGGVSVAAFGIAHYGFWDRESTVRITVAGAVLTGIYLLVRSLPVVIAVHAIHDAIGLALAGGTAETGDEAGGDR